MLVRCLGMVGVSHPDGETSLSKSQRHIVAILTAAGPHGLSSAAFADELYGNDLPEGWEASVRQAISRMRKALGVGTIATRSGRYSLSLELDEVDLWKLLSVDDIDLDSESETMLQTLLGGEPFADIEPSSLLKQTLEAIVTARIRLIERMTSGDDWSRETLLATRTLAARNHYRDDVLAPVLRLHQHVGLVSEARRLGEAARSFLRKEFDQGLGAESSVLLTGLDPELGKTEQEIDRRPLPGRIIGLYDAGRSIDLIDRSDLRREIERLLTGGGVLLDGDSGAGKSALARSVALTLAPQGCHVLWLSGRRGSPAAYEAFIAAMSSLEEDFGPLLIDGGDDLLRTKCWTAARRRLMSEFNDLPLLLVVDDAQWLDSHSQEFIDFLASSRDAYSPTMLVVGRNDGASIAWQDLADRLVRSGLTRCKVGDFTRDELSSLVGLFHNGATSKQRQDFAASLLERKAALPAVAHEIISAADPATLATVGIPTNRGRRDLWADQVGADTRRIAAIAAVLGMRFRVPALAALSGLEIETIVAAIDELLDARLVNAEQRPDEFSFHHVLVHADFDAVLDRGERRRLHLTASEAAKEAGDVHAHAVHLVEAGAVVESDVVVDALLTSAHEFRRHGSYREAVESFTLARQCTDRELAVDDLLSFASAVASSGGDGWELRAAAFEKTLEGHEVDRRLDIALNDVLRAEDATGDPRRVEMLEQIDSSTLSVNQRVAHASALARELGLLSRHEQALRISAAAVSEAAQPSDRFIAWLGAWVTCRSLPPSQWPALPEGSDQLVDPELAARLVQTRCARSLIAGADAKAREHLDEFVSHDFVVGDPLRRWHGLLLQAMFAFVDGHWKEHRRLADEAFRDGSESGVSAAFTTRVAQEFMSQWVLGDHGQLLPQLQLAPPDVTDSLLASAALAVTLAEHDDQKDDARGLIHQVVSRIAANQSPFSYPSAVLVSTAPADCRTPEVNELLRAAIEPFLGYAVVVGAAIGHLGPAAWSLARLADDPADQIELLRQACNEADRWNLRLWSVQCRLDLAAATADPLPIREASAIAHGTSLTALLPG